ncbi:MAG: type II secretion system F family protein [Candidatus Bathyarchaeia archaeon]
MKYALMGASVVAAIGVVLFGYSLYLANTISLYDAHIFVAAGVIVGMIAPAFIMILQDIRRNEIDKALPRVLEEISEGLMSGMTLIEAIEEASRRDYGWISRELKILTSQMSWGVPIEKAFDNFATRIGTDMAQKTTSLLLSSIELGGDLRTTFLSTADFLRQMLEARDDRNEEMRPYLTIIYVTLIVFLAMMIMLYGSLNQLLSIQSPIVKVQMTKEQLKILLYDLAIMEAAFGGLIAAKLSSGSIWPGLKHSIIMLAMNTIIFLLFIS